MRSLSLCLGLEPISSRAGVGWWPSTIVIPDDILQVGVRPGLVAGRKQRHVLQIVDGAHEHVARVHDRLVELVQRTVLL